MRWIPGRLVSPAASTAAAFLLLIGTAPAVAQDTAEENPDYLTVMGHVVDESTGDPLAAAVVRLATTDRAVMTDAAGRFALHRVPIGSRTLVFEQLGYTRLSLTQEFRPGTGALRVELAPQPVVLEGLSVMVDRFESRRQAAGVAVRVLRSEDFRYQPVDLFRALQLRAGLAMTTCTGRTTVSTWCLYSRGQRVAPSVWIDDRRAMGIEELELYRTEEVYAVEVYQLGRAIRVYTRQYMQNVGMGPRAMFPIWSR